MDNITKLKFSNMEASLLARGIRVIQLIGATKRYSSANGTIDLYLVEIEGKNYHLTYTQIRRLARGCSFESATSTR